MRAVIGFLGALTARLIGLALLIGPATLVTKFAAGGIAGVAVVINPLVAIAKYVPFLLLALVFISPRSTRRILRQREDLSLQIIISVILLAVLAFGLGVSYLSIPILDPSSTAWAPQTKPVFIALWGAFLVLFVLPGSYARQLAGWRDQADAIEVGHREPLRRTTSEVAADVIGVLTAWILGLVILIHPLLFVIRAAGSAGAIDLLALAGAVYNLAVAGVFLIPAFTRSVFTPAESRIGRFLFPIMAMMVVIGAMVISSISIFTGSSVELRESLTSGLGALLNLPIALFIVMFLMPGYYAKRLPLRAQLRELSRTEAELAEIAASQERVGTSAEWRDRLRAYDRQMTELEKQVKAMRPRKEPRSFVLSVTSTVASVALFGFLALAFYGWREGQFVPTAEIVSLAPQLHVPLVIVVAIIGALVAITADTRRSTVHQSVWLRILLIVPGMGVLASLGAEAFLTRGLPGAHSFLVEAPPSEISLQVTRLGEERVRRGCDNRAYARGTDYAGAEGVLICGVDPDVWNGLRGGDRIVLHGYKTPYGFRYDRVTR